MAYYKSQEITGIQDSGADLASFITSLSEMFQQGRDREKAETIDSLENILKLSNISQTPEQMANAQKALNSLSKTSSLYDSTNTAYDLVQSNLNNKRFEMNRFNSAVDQASDIINDPNFLDKADEWRDLESLRLSKTLSDGSYKYESVGEMLSDEYSAIDTLHKSIGEGIKGGYRYNKNIDFDDDDVARKIGEYKNRLDKAIQANLGDEIITLDEAQLIMSGTSKAEFGTYIIAKKNEVKDLIGDQQSLVTFYKKAIAGETEDEFYGDLLRQFMPQMSEEEQVAVAKKDIASLKEQLAEEDKTLTDLYDMHKYWTGGDYASPSAPDTIEFGAAADFDANTVNISSLDETVVTEEDLKLQKEYEGEKEKEVYTKEEKALIDSYDSDMAKLEEIDTWLKENPPVKDKFWEKDKPSTRKDYQLEKKSIKKKWKSPGGGVIRDEKGNVVADYRTGLERKVFELKKRLK